MTIPQARRILLEVATTDRTSFHFSFLRLEEDWEKVCRGKDEHPKIDIACHKKRPRFHTRYIPIFAIKILMETSIIVSFPSPVFP
jgi:hypothetical protein